MVKGFKILVAFIVGIFSGMFLFMGVNVFMQRDGSFGGEILILPLFIMLIAIGYWIAQETQVNRYQMGKQEGLRIGKDKGYLMGVRDLTEALKYIKQ
ncbi:hypothetical protein Q428_08810 [Fervidicella metallireducens AeB]|uniref:Uncharacterized protein n=1 Tax=Fervidicella metallireducens AeB TaxID=1403537 RepID=A0A017RUI8_9CLOT|nr:hypothetical protein [Fervidicella metallireducens]EYE88291.1 hypothetical protein Q428_08810 [Fervidicella metallireducens AeB]